MLAAALGGTAVAQTATKKEEPAIGAGAVIAAPLTAPNPKADDARRFTPAEVRAMQRHLVKTGYLKARLGTKWTPAARRAMRAWQRANGLAVTGRMNRQSFAYVEAR